MNAIVLAVVRCGGNGNVRGGDGLEPSIQFFDSAVQFRLTIGPGEGKRLKRNESLPEGLPVGLRLSILDPHGSSPNRRVWEDTEEQIIETQISEIVVDLITTAEIQYRESCARRHRWLMEQKEVVKTRIDQERQLAEVASSNQAIEVAKEKLHDLLKMAKNLRCAEDIRALVKGMRDASPDFSDICTKSRFENWCRWALSQADEIDPLRRITDFFG